MEKLIINTSNIRYNTDTLRKQAGVQLIGIVDHGGYGCGSRFLARAFVKNGVQILAASDVETADLILDDFPQINLLLMCPAIGKKELDCIVKRGAIATVAGIEDAVMLNAAAEENGSIVKAHILIRTSKNGCGITFSQAKLLADKLFYCHSIEIDGAYGRLNPTKIASQKVVLAQKDIFEKTVETLNNSGIKTQVLHLAEGYAALRYSDIRYNAVRVGDAVIGRMKEKNKWELREIGEIETEIKGIVTVPTEEEKAIKSTKERRYAVVGLSCTDSVKVALKNSIIPFCENRIYCSFGKKKLYCVSDCGSELLLLDPAKSGISAGDSVRFPADPRLVNADCERNYE